MHLWEKVLQDWNIGDFFPGESTFFLDAYLSANGVWTSFETDLPVDIPSGLGFDGQNCQTGMANLTKLLDNYLGS